MVATNIYGVLSKRFSCLLANNTNNHVISRIEEKRALIFKSKHWHPMLVCLGLSRLFFYFVFVFANLASALPCFVVVLMAEEAVDMKTQSDASDAEDQESTAQFLELIEQRFRDELFPAVLPQEQEKCADANDILLLVQKEEAVAVQTHLDQKYKLYLEQCSVDPSISEPVTRAGWAREFYYTHIKNFYAKTEKRDVIFDVVRLLVDIEKMPESAQQHLKELCDSIPAQDREIVLGFIDDVWNTQWQALPSYMRKDEPKCRCQWFQECCMQVLEDYMQKKNGVVDEVFASLENWLDISNSTPEQVSALRKCCAEIAAEHRDALKKHIQDTWDNAWNELPPFARKNQVSAQGEWFQAMGVEVIKDFAQNFEPSATVFVPEISVADIRDESKQEYSMLLGSIKAADAAPLEVYMEESFETAFLSLPHFVVKNKEKSVVRRDFMLEHYHPLLKKWVEVRNCVAENQSSSLQEAESCAEASASMFASPKKKPRVQQQDPDTSPPRYEAVQVLHTASGLTTDALQLEAYVMHYSVEPRYVKIARGRQGAEETVPVISVLVADRTGPIVIEAWREAATMFLENLLQWDEGRADNEQLLVEITYFVVKDDNRVHQTPVRKLHTNERTRLQRRSVGSQNAIVNVSVTPDASLFTRELRKVCTKPPYIISIVGIVVEVQGLTVTQSGDSRKDFRLQDTTGQYVECAALGRHAENNNLVEGNEVILYFLTALAGLRGRPGLLWLYDDSHVAMVRKHIVTVPLRQVCALAI